MGPTEKALVGLLPLIWIPILILVAGVFTVLAWILPTWRGSALAACGGFLTCLPGLWCSALLVRIRPAWALRFLQWVDREASLLPSPELKSQGTFLFVAVLGGFLSYLLGLLAVKLVLRLWHRYWGDTLSEEAQRTILSPFH